MESAIFSCSARRSCLPLRYVPLVDPTSSMYMKSPRGKILAWADEANGSSTSMSLFAERPRVAPPLPRSNTVPGSCPIAATTSRCGWTPDRRSGPARSRGRRTPVSSLTTAESSCVTRSRDELRATQSRNRYSTMRKANLSATATGSSVMSLLLLEREPREAERDLVPRLQHGVLHAPAVHLHAVRRSEIAHDPGVVLAAQLGVPPRHVGIVDHHVALSASTQKHPRASQHRAAAVTHQHRATARRRLHQLTRLAVRRVDHRVPVVRRPRLLLAGLLVGRLDQVRLDTELAHAQALVGAELHGGPGHERQPLAAGVLQQIVR